MIDQAEKSNLLSRVALGDAGAVRECLRVFGPLVMALSMKMLGHRADAEDATQEIFLDLWKSASRYDASKGSETTFVATLARRRLIDRRRKFNPTVSGEKLDDIFSKPENNYFETSDEAMKIRRLLNNMEPEHRTIVLLAIDEGLSHAEIAEKQAMPLGTVKTIIRRTLQKIRDSLSPGGES